MGTTEKRLVRWDDIFYAARVWSKMPEFFMEFELLQIHGIEDEAGALIFERPDGKQTNESDEAEVLAHGSIKWDGCMNYAFPEKNGMLHVCGVSGVKQLCEAFEKLYEEARKLMPGFRS